MTESLPAAYRAGMDNIDPIAQLRALAARLDQLTAQAQRLADENRSLRQQQEQLAGERAQLLAKNEQARSRVGECRAQGRPVHRCRARGRQRA